MNKTTISIQVQTKLYTFSLCIHNSRFPCLHTCVRWPYTCLPCICTCIYLQQTYNYQRRGQVQSQQSRKRRTPPRDPCPPAWWSDGQRWQWTSRYRSHMATTQVGQDHFEMTRRCVPDSGEWTPEIYNNNYTMAQVQRQNIWVSVHQICTRKVRLSMYCV